MTGTSALYTARSAGDPPKICVDALADRYKVPDKAETGPVYSELVSARGAKLSGPGKATETDPSLDSKSTVNAVAPLRGAVKS